MNETEPAPESATVTLDALATELRTRIRILLAWATWADIAIVNTRTGAVTAESANHLRILHALDRSGPPEIQPAPTHTLIPHADIEDEPQIDGIARLLDVPWHQREELARADAQDHLARRRPS